MLLTVPPGIVTPTEVRFHYEPDRSDDGHVVAAVQSGGVWAVDTTSLPAGRSYPVLVGQPESGEPIEADLPYVDLPEDDSLIVSPEYLAKRAKMTLPLSEDDRETIREAILDAQSDVVAYLGRPILPAVRVEANVFPYPDGWRLNSLGDDDLIGIVSAVAETDPGTGEPNGLFTITYRYGIDARLDEYRPIRRYVIAHTLNSSEFTTLWSARTKAKGRITSLSAEGQSVGFAKPTLGREDTGKPGDLSPGSLPTLASLDYWRLAGRRVHVATTRTSDWPFTGTRW